MADTTSQDGETSSRTEVVRGPIAFISDVHGNLAALEAVLAALREAHAGALYVAGDLLFRGAQPLEVWKALQDAGARCVRGTSDLALASIDPEKLRPRDEEQRRAAEQFRWTQKAVGELILARLRRLPDAIRLALPDGSEIVVVHGSPADPTETITHDMSDDEVRALLGTDPADVVVCGASHVAFVREVAGVKIVGVGSVGESPEGRYAHYTLAHPRADGVEITQHAVAF